MDERVLKPVLFFDDPSDAIDGIRDMRPRATQTAVAPDEMDAPPWQKLDKGTDDSPKGTVEELEPAKSKKLPPA